MGLVRRFPLRFRLSELWRALPKEFQTIYSDLDPSSNRLSSLRERRETRAALETLVALCDTASDVRASTLIAAHSPHLRGSSLERTVHPRALEVRNDPSLQAIMARSIGNLIEDGISSISEYVRSGRPLALDAFRAGLVGLKTAALFNPKAVHDTEKSLRRTFGSRIEEYPIIESFLPSASAWGCDAHTILEGDLAYLHFRQRMVNDGDRGVCHASHVLAYNAPPRLGRRLLEMMPEEARGVMRQDADRIRESLITEATKKVNGGYTNAAWVGAIYLKVQVSINYLDGSWTKLSPLHARKLHDLIVSARYKTQALEGAERRRLHAAMSSVETTLIRTPQYELQTKIYRARNRH